MKFNLSLSLSIYIYILKGELEALGSDCIAHILGKLIPTFLLIQYIEKQPGGTLSARWILSADEKAWLTG
jgi:hypothetical protein